MLIDNIKIDDWIYIDDYYDNVNVVGGGLAQVSEVDGENIKLKGFPLNCSFTKKSTVFNNQAELKQRFKNRLAEVFTDINEPLFHLYNRLF